MDRTVLLLVSCLLIPTFTPADAAALRANPQQEHILGRHRGFPQVPPCWRMLGGCSLFSKVQPGIGPTKSPLIIDLEKILSDKTKPSVIDQQIPPLGSLEIPNPRT